MKADIFFKHYIPALENAIANSAFEGDYFAVGPDHWYPIELCKEMDLFEELNVRNYKILEYSGWYFFALAHNEQEVSGISMISLKNDILRLIESYKLTCDLGILR